MGEKFWSWCLANKVRAYLASFLTGLLIVLLISVGFWPWYKANRDHIVPLLTFVGAGALAWAALRQAKMSALQAKTAAQQAQTAADQAETARKRHEEQIKTDRERADADRQRRITDSFAKAVEQLGSEKLQVRFGGIYTLERIARESEPDYWPIMETLTAFVRVQAPWKNENAALPQVAIGHEQPEAPLRPLPADIEAVLAVIMRRDAKSREREQVMRWRLDLTLADLRMAFLRKAHLERADLRETHLEGAFLNRAHLQNAVLRKAHLEGAFLAGAHLEGANLTVANLEGANITVAHLEGANLGEATGLKQDQLDQAFGNAETQIPDGLKRPSHWQQ